MTERTEFKPEDCVDKHLMSNFDHEVHKDVAEKLRTSAKLWAPYTGECFYGYCWFEDGAFHCAVKRYMSWRGVYRAKTPEKLMKLIVADYGPL